MKEVHYTLNNRRYFGIGFFNNSDGIEIRNLYSKICLGNKDVTLIRKKDDPRKRIAVFEGFFDYLTFINIEKEEVLISDYLILNSTLMFFKVEEKLKEYDKISLFLDKDANGKSVREMIQKQYKNVEDCSLMYSDYKDLNEWFL